MARDLLDMLFVWCSHGNLMSDTGVDKISITLSDVFSFFPCEKYMYVYYIKWIAVNLLILVYDLS